MLKTLGCGKSRSFLLAWLSWGGAGVFLIVLLISGMSLFSRYNLEKYRSDLEARGETLSVARLAAPRPSKKENGATDFLSACHDLDKFGPMFGSAENDLRHIFMGQIDPAGGIAEVAHRRSSAKSRAREISWEEFRQTFGTLNSCFEEIQRTSASPNFDFDMDYSKSPEDWIEFLNCSNTAGRFLAIENLLLLHDGRISEAVENVRTILRLSAALRNERTNISMRLSAAMIHMASIATWEILYADPSREDLHHLREAWFSVKLTKDISATLRFDRAIATREFRKSLATKTAEVMKIASSHGSLPAYEEWRIRLGVSAFYGTWTAFFQASDELQLLRDYQSLIDLVSSGVEWTHVLTKEDEIRKALLRAPFRRLGSWEPFFRFNSLSELAVADSISKLTLAAVAIAQYQSDHGGVPPESLSSLVPEYLPAVPLDIMDLQPIKYRKTGGDFLLYTVGTDGKDDGGSATSGSFPDSKDIVWPRAVTPATSGTGSGTPPASPPSPP